MSYKTIKNKYGFTLVETLVGIAVFLLISISAYNAYVSIFRLINLNKYKVIAINLANEQFEIAKNMPYKDVGVVGSIPVGLIPRNQTLTRGGINFDVETIIRNIDLPFDGTIGGSPNDLSPADNKLVEVTVSCINCEYNLKPIIVTGRVAPKNLETASANGALFVRVFDANGQSIQGALVHIQNIATSTVIDIEDVTDANGMLQVVDVPPQQNAYRISVSKEGYSQDRTYPLAGSSNPYPLKPDASVVIGQVTQVSFAIDKLSTVTFSSKSPTCTPISNYSFNITSSKLIGQEVNKYSTDKTTASNGKIVLNNVEWDTYTITPKENDRDLAGVNPLSPITVNPDSNIDVSLILKNKNDKSLLIVVRDSVTQLPLSNATVTIAINSHSNSSVTGKGYIEQTDWHGGSGQTDYIDESKYYSDDGGLDVSTSTGNILLTSTFGLFNNQGSLISSVIDLGDSSNFHTLSWSPTDSPVSTGPDAIKLQFATNSENTATTTWNFVGPDGTSATFYTVSDSSLSSIHNGHRYAKYKLYLHTDLNTVSPIISSISFTYTSSCTPSGQVIFQGLDSGTHDVTVKKSGYQDWSQNVEIESDWQELSVSMTPE